MTTVDEANDDASTGRYVETVVIASANANVGMPRIASVTHSPRRKDRSAVAMVAQLPATGKHGRTRSGTGLAADGAARTARAVGGWHRRRYRSTPGCRHGTGR